LGLGCGVLAQMVFGLADAIALGQKPGLFIWAFLGLGGALWLQVTRQGTGEAARMAYGRVLKLPSRAYRWSALVFVVLVILACATAGVARARTRLAAVQGDLAALQALAREGPAAVAPMQADELLTQMHADLADVRVAYALPLAVAPRLGWAPRYGADLQAAPVLLQMGLDLTAAGEQVMGALQPLLNGEDSEVSGPERMVTAHGRSITPFERLGCPPR